MQSTTQAARTVLQRIGIKSSASEHGHDRQLRDWLGLGVEE